MFDAPASQSDEVRENPFSVELPESTPLPPASHGHQRKRSLGNPFDPAFDPQFAESAAVAQPASIKASEELNGGADSIGTTLSQEHTEAAQSLIQCMTGQMENMTMDLLQKMETAKTPIVSPMRECASDVEPGITPSPEPEIHCQAAPELIQSPPERPPQPKRPPPRPEPPRKQSPATETPSVTAVEFDEQLSEPQPDEHEVTERDRFIAPDVIVSTDEVNRETSPEAVRKIPIITEQKATPRNSMPDVLAAMESPVDETAGEIKEEVQSNVSGNEEGTEIQEPSGHTEMKQEMTAEQVNMAKEEHPTAAAWDDSFDAFAARFDAVEADTGDDTADPFSGGGASAAAALPSESSVGFGDAFAMDSFIPMEPPPVPQSTPMHAPGNSFAGTSPFSERYEEPSPDVQQPFHWGPIPNDHVAVPPGRPVNPFLELDLDATQKVESEGGRSQSVESPSTPLFDLDVSQPLEVFPRITWENRRFSMFLRQPNKKKITSQRFWKKIVFHLTQNGVVQLYNSPEDTTPFQELPLQACYAVSDISAQQFDQFGKVFTIKLQYVYYKERPGVRPGQMSKAERLTSKLGHFASSAIAGDLAGVKEFGSDLKKLGVPIEHAPQISELMKLGSQSYEDLKLVTTWIDEHLFKIPLHRDRALTYKTEEIQFTTIDEFVVDQDVQGVIFRMVARVRVFLLAFISGMPEIEVGINNLIRQGKEVVGRHDIIPVITEEWIRLEDEEFHNTVDQEYYKENKVIKCSPPDATYIELLRFRVRPPKNRELPLQVKTVFNFSGNRVRGQFCCTSPLKKRMGKVKGLERFLGAVETPNESLMEVTSGQAKYEHHHRAIVWRIPRLPKEGQGAYTTHNFVSRLTLTSFDQMPESFDKYVHVEFTMPATTVSHCVIRSVSIPGSDPPPEKFVRYVAKHEYKVEIEFTKGSAINEYAAVTLIEKPAAQATQSQQLSQRTDPVPSSSSDSD
ncbi:unnamed protein product [Cyprideis torosa]|uniref:Uncharacterized protein n=1 Tax=Cyprideis torosa TaxID=163714 RepID=A0A7R8W9V3_9CRUS|nr:unnamed protein product [Cyprideis torosa]CAG0887705.1 unnamed protein product [Cyprideis torosa]